MQESYRIQNWGDRYFHINDQGHIGVKANGTHLEGDLFELVQSLVLRGIDAPILLRFNGVIKDRIRRLHLAFESAIQEFHYQNSYRITYPIKVNPQRHVVELIQKEGSPYVLGLEVGSKPEVLAVLTLEESPNTLVLCNGYKDAEYIELALLASKLGRRTVIIVEQVYEVKLIIETAKRLGIEAELGLRFRPVNKGTGRWQTSGGDFAKFGLDAHEVMLCLEQLEQAGLLHWLKLFHFHIGSQITSIESIQKALQEAACLYTALATICPSLNFFDAGGGLGVDYDGSKSATDSSTNYSVEEYARNVVSAIGEACQKAQVAAPVIITESGRALVAHHAVLITEVIDVASIWEEKETIEEPPSHRDIPVSLYTLYHQISPENCLEVLHDAFQLKEMIVESFIHGQLSLSERAYSERVYQYVLAKILRISKELKEIPEEIERLNQTCLDMYFCNFSVFQSLPDSWAIGQLFPIMPIHRLQEEPDRKAIIADLSCDSDGKISQFIGAKGIPKPYLPLHKMDTTPYYLGIFLVGAYQEILGDLHNLFGDTNVVHVELTEDGTWEIKQVIEGDTIEEVLHYTQYHPGQLLENLKDLIEKSLKAGRLSTQESGALKKKIKQALESYTYLVV